MLAIILRSGENGEIAPKNAEYPYETEEYRTLIVPKRFNVVK